MYATMCRLIRYVLETSRLVEERSNTIIFSWVRRPSWIRNNFSDTYFFWKLIYTRTQCPQTRWSDMDSKCTNMDFLRTIGEVLEMGMGLESEDSNFISDSTCRYGPRFFGFEPNGCAHMSSWVREPLDRTFRCLDRLILWENHHIFFT